MTGLRFRKALIWMVVGAGAFMFVGPGAMVDNYKTMAFETIEDAFASVRVAAADGRGNLAAGDQGASGQRTVHPAVSFSADHTKLMAGDQLKISIYERVGTATETSSTTALSSLVEHTEMSGEYTVQTDGGIFIPFIGRIEAAGKTGDALQKELESKIASAFSGYAVSTVRLLQREPIYVTGGVVRPGTFKYTPGMMVLNALILAGSLPGEQANWQNIEMMRMMEHLNQADVKLANLLAQRDVLVALRDGKQPVASRPLVNLVGTQVSDYIATAEKLASLKEEKYGDELQAIAADRQMLEKQRGILTESVNDALAALNHAKERVDAVKRMRKMGVTTDNTYYQAVGEYDTARARLNDIKSGLAKLESQIVEINEREKRVIVDAKITREQQISDLRLLIAETAVTRDTLRPALAATQTGLVAGETPRYTILRRNGETLEKIDADRFSSLQPGDIVEVVRTVNPFLDANAETD